MGVVAGARDDFFNASAFVTDNLRFYRFKIHRATFLTGFVQGLVNLVQMQQVVHTVFVFDRLRAFGIGQNGSHVGIGKTCVAEHHRRVKLVGRHFAVGVDKHVADHAQALHLWVE